MPCFTLRGDGQWGAPRAKIAVRLSLQKISAEELTGAVRPRFEPFLFGRRP
jgi:hypothetical protein